MKKQYVALAILETYGAEFLEAEASAQAELSSGSEAPESDLLNVFEGVGVIEVKGKLTNKDSYFNSWYGLVSYNQIRAAVVEALELGANAILFDYDTPGGAVSGMGDHSNFISSIPVETVGHTSGTMASAGYFSGASNDHLFADELSEVGSIGVVMQHMEMTEAVKKAGYKVDIIRSGSRKAIGGPYEKLTATNRKILQDQVNVYADKFFSFVSEERGMPLPTMTDIKEGGTYIGQEAVQVGLVDKIMSFDEALAFTIGLAQKKAAEDENQGFNDYYGNNHAFNSSTEQKGEQGMAAKKISKKALAALVNAGNEKPAPGADDGKEENTNVPAEGADENLNTEDTEGTTEAEAMEDTPDLSAELLEMTEKYDASQVELAESAEKLEASETVLADLSEKHSAEVADFSEVIIAQINTMRVALNLTAVDMSAFAPTAVMVEYNALMKTFENSLPVGGVVPNEQAETKSETVSRTDVGDVKALAF